MGKYDKEVLDWFLKQPGNENCVVRIVDGTLYYMQVEEFMEICGNATIREMREGSPHGWHNTPAIEWTIAHAKNRV